MTDEEYYERTLAENNETENEVVEITPSRWTKIKNSTLFYLFKVAVITLFLCRFVFAIAYVEGASMEPTYTSRDVVISFRLAKPSRGQVAIIQSDALDCCIIKRIIAKGGDTISIYDGVTYLNGQRLNEDYINKDVTRDFTEVTVPEGYYFVMGDNRPNSIDSRNGLISFVSEDDIVGVVFLHI